MNVLRRNCNKILSFSSRRVLDTRVRNCINARKVDITGSKQIFMFDTHLLMKSLQDSGFTPSQAETTVYALVQISQGKMDYIQKHLVTKEQQEILLQQILSHISSIKKDMIILEKSEFSSLKHEYEHAESEKHLEKLQNKIEILTSEHDKHISSLDNKIEKEIAHLLATYERYRNDIIKYAGGTVMTCLTICLGFYRLWA